MKLETAAAIEVAGLARHVWNDGLRRREYTEAPPAAKGVPRQLDRDDVLAMSLQAQLVTLGLRNGPAWKIADSVRAALRAGGEEIESLWITCNAAGQPHRVVTRLPKGDPGFITVPVAELREKITALVEARLARGARN